LIAVLQISFYYGDLYHRRTFRRRYEEVLSIAQSLGAASVCLGVLYWLFPVLLIGRGVFFLSLSLVAILVLLSRVLLDRAWSFAAPAENVVILGSQELGLTVAREIQARNDLNLNLIGFINRKSTVATPSSIEGVPVLGQCETLEDIAAQHHVSRVVVALEEQRGSLPIRELVRLRVRGIFVEDAQSILSSLTGRVWLQTVRPSWFVFSTGFHRSKTTVVLKRIMDVMLSVAMLLIASPIMLAVAIAIRLDSKGPVTYRQARVGLRGDVFDVLKFRSMRPDAEAENGVQWAQADDPRVTRLGGFLRKYRLDELPQLINVLRGQMSFVGPRPERPYFVEQLRKEIAYYDERHSVRPGITGWAQVSYRYGASVEDAFRKLEYDLFYLKNLSVFFDCAIIFRTARIVMTGSGGR
jgi:sugar transferase (PEP-CTERM system associated)